MNFNYTADPIVNLTTQAALEKIIEQQHQLIDLVWPITICAYITLITVAVGLLGSCCALFCTCFLGTLGFGSKFASKKTVNLATDDIKFPTGFAKSPYGTC